ERFAFELGLSPELEVASVEDCTAFFNEALDEGLTAAAVREMNALGDRLGVEDWRADVKRIADEARVNDIAPGALPEMGKRCADDLLAHFPAKLNGDLDAGLLAAVHRALERIDLALDTTAGTAAYVEKLRSAIYALRRPPCAWKHWLTLAKEKATKKSEAHADRVREAASVYAAHPRFQAEIRRYLERVYSLAADALERFQRIKMRRGLIDFNDMEQYLLHALDEQAVRARLGEELELLLVDEFQDTSPMQLAIFMKLAALADKAVFVGDVKQAIYAFRGCDPDLVFATLEALTARGGESDVLEHSWRSRPALVDYVNSVFGQAFAGRMRPEQIELRPKRAERTGEPAVLRWSIKGKDEVRAAALARAVGDLVASAFRVVDPDSDAPRPVRWGDIAVLAASNDHVETLARALRAAQIPIRMTLKGLLEVPEVCLAKACLARLNDHTDTLATAEIVSMCDCSAPETWLGARLRWLAQDEDGYGWAETAGEAAGVAAHPVVAKLKALRESLGAESPVEIVARVLNYVGIREVVTAWGPNAIKAAQRQRNLDALLNLAVEYERHCDSQHLAATLTGFLFWLEHPHSAELDIQPAVTTGDAVHVLTYHKAKGLEWPVVVATDLHYRWRPRLWSVRVEGPEDFDLERPLAGRVLRYWPQVFGQHEKDVPVLDVLRECEEGRRCLERGVG
ncbi:MAG TPA: UvrD-helicase domain-containing protein, partial [Gammaproteobacteria bacterium]|nr:UvrD-helicase domain-containing protein [Gammaproteobacteria bacterium]